MGQQHRRRRAHCSAAVCSSPPCSQLWRRLLRRARSQCGRLTTEVHVVELAELANVRGLHLVGSGQDVELVGQLVGQVGAAVCDNGLDVRDAFGKLLADTV